MDGESSMAHSAPSGNSTGSPNAHYDYAEEPLPPQGHQSQSWVQTTVRFVRGLWKTPMSGDPQARLAEAKRLQNATSWLDRFNPFAQSDRIETAVKIYEDVAQQFLNAKKRVEAGETFEKAALLELSELKKNDGTISNCIQNFDKAHLAYYNERPVDSARCLQQIIKLWTSNGNYSAATTWSEKLGELYSTKCDNQEKAIEAWQNAGDWHQNSRNMALAARPYNKVAEAYAKKGDYYKAIETWEWCGYNFPIPSTGIKSGTAITYFFRAGLCHVAIADIVALSRAIHHYVDADNSFGKSRECRFLFDLSKAMENGDDVQFKHLQGLYEKAGELPPPQRALLEEGVRRLREAGEDFS